MSRTATGGSGKNFTVSSNGTITVNRPNGSSSTVRPGDSNYNKTKDAMDADTGRGQYSGGGSSSSNSSRPSSSGNSSGGSSSSGSSPSPSSRPDTYYGSLVEKRFEAIIKDKDGNVIGKHETYIKDGAMYDATTGKILSSNHGVSGAYGDPSTHEKIWDPTTGIGYFIEKELPASSWSSSSGGSYYYPPPPPPRPPFMNFNEPMPTFKSDLKEVAKYTYYSGIDSVHIKRVKMDNEVGFVSAPIKIGKLKEEEYIKLDAKYFTDAYSSVEFYILDGEKEVPVLPLGDKKVLNEKIFYNKSTRFLINEQEKVIIKKGGAVTNISLVNASNASRGVELKDAYNISYTPNGDFSKYKPESESIRIKVIIRAYNIGSTAPFVEAIKIRKYGSSLLWNQTI